MEDPEETIAKLKPNTKTNVIDLVRDAGVDTSDWANYEGNPSQNPKYCYNWSFAKPGEFIIICLWHEDIKADGDTVLHKGNIRLSDGRAGGKGAANWRRRADDFDDHIQQAYRMGLPVRVIVVEGNRRDHLDPDPDPDSSKINRRILDPVAWAILRYDFANGEYLLVRGASPTENVEQDAPEYIGFEGEKRRLYVLHRRREASIRAKKVKAAMIENGGALRCEVLRCGFDFKARYGKLGEGFAHVHHVVPLADAPIDGRPIALKELKVVCANCHAMIHLGGECRPLEGLIPASLD